MFPLTQRKHCSSFLHSWFFKVVRFPRHVSRIRSHAYFIATVDPGINKKFLQSQSSTSELAGPGNTYSYAWNNIEMPFIFSIVCLNVNHKVTLKLAIDCVLPTSWFDLNKLKSGHTWTKAFVQLELPSGVQQRQERPAPRSRCREATRGRRTGPWAGT